MFGRVEGADGRGWQARGDDLVRIGFRRRSVDASLRDVGIDVALELRRGFVSKADVLLQVRRKGQALVPLDPSQTAEENLALCAERLQANRMADPKQWPTQDAA
jgi:hypothetical protein